MQIIAEHVALLGDTADGPAVSSTAAKPMEPRWYPGSGTKLFIKIPAHLERTNLSDRIAHVLTKYHGDVRVYFHLMGSRKTILTSPTYWVTTDDVLRQELEALLEPGSVVLK